MYWSTPLMPVSKDRTIFMGPSQQRGSDQPGLCSKCMSQNKNHDASTIVFFKRWCWWYSSLHHKTLYFCWASQPLPLVIEFIKSFPSSRSCSISINNRYTGSHYLHHHVTHLHVRPFLFNLCISITLILCTVMFFWLVVDLLTEFIFCLFVYVLPFFSVNCKSNV